MLLLRLEPSGPVPAYLQIRDRIVELIDDGTLRPGDRLPSTRGFAASIGVHRSTVVRAYDEIRALGYLESRSGSYSTVRHRARPPRTSTKAEKEAGQNVVDWFDVTTESVRSVHTLESQQIGTEVPVDCVDFEQLAADPSLAPADELRRCLNSVMLRSGPSVLDYADPAGWRPLREAVSARLRSHGVAVSADEILITSGAQAALDLTLRMLTQPGDRIVVEAPTYGLAHALLRLHGLVPIEVPMREYGMDLDELERVIELEGARLVYTMPNFHNPTGITTDQAHRERLLGICERRRVPVLEDGFEEEMKYQGPAVLPIKSMDSRGLVLYVGTFSKVVFPGLRVGWIAASREAITLLASIQHASCVASSTLAQAAAERFVQTGRFEAFLRRIHRIYRRRLQVMLEGLEKNLPVDVHWTRPVGGYTVWMTLPGGTEDERSWCDRLAEVGVKVAPGSRFFGVAPTRPHVRLSIACVDEERIAEGCRRIGEVVARG